MLAPLLPAYAATTLSFEDFSSVTTPGSCIGGSLASMEVRGGVRLRLPSLGSLLFTAPYAELVGRPANVRGPAVGKTGFVLQPGSLYTVSFLAFGDLGRSSSSDALFVDFWPSFAFPTTLAAMHGRGCFCPAEHGTMPPPLSTFPADFTTTLRPSALLVEGSVSTEGFEPTDFGFWIGSSSSGDGVGGIIDWVKFTAADVPATPPGGGGGTPPSDMPPFLPPVTAIPEPATWAMLIAGFGLVGLAAPRRRPARAMV